MGTEAGAAARPATAAPPGAPSPHPPPASPVDLAPGTESTQYPTRAGALRRLGLPALAWAVMATAATVAQYLGVAAGGIPRQAGIDGYVQGWPQYDSWVYIQIATSGYTPGNPGGPMVAWFPGYPLAIRTVASIGFGADFAAIVVATAAGLASAILFWVWSGGFRLTRAERVGALALLLVYPFSWFLYGGAYSNSLFVALALAAFVAVERDRYLRAAIAACLATAVRPLGFALVVGLVVLALERSGVLTTRSWRRPGGGLQAPIAVHTSALRKRHAVLLLSTGGLLAYMTFLGVARGDPLAFLDAQDHWYQGPTAGPGTWLKLDYLRSLFDGPSPLYVLQTASQGLLVVGVAATTPWVGRRLGWGYAVFQLLFTASLFTMTSSFIGAGRYLLSAVPCFLLVGSHLGRKRRLGVPVLAASSVVLLILTFAYSQGAYIT